MSGQETDSKLLASHSPSQKLRWWNPPPSLSALHCDAFLPPRDLQGSKDIWETRKEKTLALAKVLQSCYKQSGVPYSMMCQRTARDHERCMANLMHFWEEDVLEIPLLDPADDMPVASPTPLKEATLLDEPQEAQVTATYPVTCKELAPKPESATRQGRQQQNPMVCRCTCCHCQDSDCHYQGPNHLFLKKMNH